MRYAQRQLFHVGYTPEGVWKLMRRHGWSCQVPVRQAMERDEAAVVSAVWKAEVWPDIKERRERYERGLRDRLLLVAFRLVAFRDVVVSDLPVFWSVG